MGNVVNDEVLEAKLAELQKLVDEHPLPEHAQEQEYSLGEPETETAINICAIVKDAEPVISGIKELVALFNPTWANYIQVLETVAASACPAS